MQTLIVLLVLAVTLFFAVRRIVCNPSRQSPCHHNNLCSKPEDEKPLDFFSTRIIM